MAVILPFTFATLPATPNPSASDLDANFVALANAINGLAPLTVPRSYIAGCTLSNDVGTPNTILDIAAGQVADSTNVVAINLAAITKSTGGVWAAGSGSAGMGTGLTVANSTWYHVFAILNGGAADVYFDTSASAAHAPAGTTAFRRLGAVKTDGSAHLNTFVQQGNYFEWKAAQVNELSASAAPTVSRTLLSLVGVPPGVSVLGQFTCDVVGGTDIVLLTDPAITDVAATSQNFSVIATTSGGGETQIRTSATPQIGYRSANGQTITINTKGWFDFRGTDL